ncbi:hypothetical protein HJG54_35290 (plasmid) [Leptolyngbya sp. NK1-12]|uniref:Uncharacterized protein n=1 Tax=Leptolyngbya sp. NK1-12 TaxID=2547451 RepID=A0AA96WN72_9CYAN|nr:hypothetical protein [Leptolyngbya sp. NK1-12]WNZ28180.1 hypothetical protein HJG54_35290 [Leptolyngbya sp. NK1-12]
MSQARYTVLLTEAQLEFLINLIKNSDAQLQQAIDALNAPNVRTAAKTLRILQRAQDEMFENIVE